MKISLNKVRLKFSFYCANDVSFKLEKIVFWFRAFFFIFGGIYVQILLVHMHFGKLETSSLGLLSTITYTCVRATF